MRAGALLLGGAEERLRAPRPHPEAAGGRGPGGRERAWVTQAGGDLGGLGARRGRHGGPRRPISIIIMFTTTTTTTTSTTTTTTIIIIIIIIIIVISNKHNSNYNVYIYI